MMSHEFKNKVQKVLSKFLLEKEFCFEESFVSDNGNKVVVVYNSPQCKLCFYRSQRDGEVNCLVGPINAGASDLSNHDWVFLNSLFTLREDLSIEQLLSDVPDSPKSDEEQLEEIAIKLVNNYNSIINSVAGLR